MKKQFSIPNIHQKITDKGRQCLSGKMLLAPNILKKATGGHTPHPGDQKNMAWMYAMNNTFELVKLHEPANSARICCYLIMGAEGLEPSRPFKVNGFSSFCSFRYCQ